MCAMCCSDIINRKDFLMDVPVFYHRLSIKYKFLVPIIPMLLISYSLILGYTFYIFQTETKQTVRNQLNQTVCDKINYFNGYLYQLNQETDNFLYGNMVQKYLLSPDGTFSGFSEEISRTILLFDTYPSNLYLEDKNGDFYTNNTIYSSTQSQYELKREWLAPQVQTYHGKMYFHYSPDTPSIFTMARSIYKLDTNDTNQEIGFFMCDVSTNCFFDIFGYRADSDVISYVLTTADNQMIASNSGWSRSDLEDMLQSAAFPALVNGSHIYKYQTNYPQLKLFALVNEELLFQSVYHSFFIQLFIILLSLFLIAIFIFLVARSIERQFASFIQKITHTNQIDSKAYITVHSQDEFSHLAQVYNDMLKRIHNLIETVYEQELLNQNAQLKSLQSQINPHFLYNTLDSISSLIDLGRPKDAQKAILALGCIMRMSIKGNDILTIGEDLEYVKQYLFIQKLRFHEKVLFLVEVPQTLYAYSIPKLCIQPLIENSLIHGVGNFLENGMIVISGREDETCIYISVCDNGVPIPASVQQMIRTDASEIKLNGAEMDVSNHIGLMNIQRRIRILYGNSYGLRIQVSDEGNQVTIVLPKHPQPAKKDEKKRTNTEGGDSCETFDCG